MKKQLSYLSFIFLSLSLNSLADFSYTSGSSDDILISTSNDESGYEGANALTSGFTNTSSDNWSSSKRGMYNWYGVASSSSTTLTDGTAINGEYIQISNSDSTTILLEELLVFEPLSVPYHDVSNYYARTAHLVGSNDSSALSAGSGDSVWELLSSTSTVGEDGSSLSITGAPDTYVKIENSAGIGYKYYRYVISETGNNPYRTGASGIAFTEFVDTDSDGDGIGDSADAFPSDPSESVDTDGDGVGNNADADDDGDGLSDLEEATNGTNPLLADTDGDGVGDNTDAFPSDPSESVDTDGDGVGNNADVDDDGDGLSDLDEATNGTNPLLADTDGDGAGDNTDAFPTDPDEYVDTDGDGVGDNTDAFSTNPYETADTDGDGVGDNGDAFPSDATETADTDGDGVGDNGDVHPGFNDAELTTYLSNNNYAKTSEIIDARAGSTLITVSNGVATVELKMEKSDDLQTWTAIDGSTTMDIPADASVKFFRFKMAD